MKKKITALRDKQTLQRQTVETTACNTKANYISFYYMAEFASGHLNSKWQLKMGPSCPFLRKKYLFGDIINLSLAKLFRSKWLVLALFFFAFLLTSTWSRSKNPKKELGQYPTILNSSLVNKAYKYIAHHPSWKLTYVFTFAPKYFKKWLCCFHWSVVATCNELFVNSELAKRRYGNIGFHEIKQWTAMPNCLYYIFC